MTPIEAMIRAYDPHGIEGCSDHHYEFLLSRMRAAVLVLAGLELPEDVTDAGFDYKAVDGVKERHARLQARFRAMLHSIASAPTPE